MNENKVLLIVIAALLVLSVVATGVLIFNSGSVTTGASVSEDVNTISVSSSGEVTVLPDVGYITLGIQTKDIDVKLAENENSSIMNDILAALEEFDIEDTDIKTVNYSIYPQYDDYTDEKPTSYAVYNSIQVTVKKIEDMGDIIDAAVEAGANSSNSISFDVLDREGSYNEALKNAVANARARAEVLAEAAGLKIVGVVSVYENSSYSPYYYSDALYSRAASVEESAPSISTGDMEITANVTVIFEVAEK